MRECRSFSADTLLAGVVFTVIVQCTPKYGAICQSKGNPIDTRGLVAPPPSPLSSGTVDIWPKRYGGRRSERARTATLKVKMFSLVLRSGGLGGYFSGSGGSVVIDCALAMQILLCHTGVEFGTFFSRFRVCAVVVVATVAV